MLDIGQLRI